MIYRAIDFFFFWRGVLPTIHTQMGQFQYNKPQKLFTLISSTSLLQIDMLQIILNCQHPPWTRRDFDLD